jgi:recombination protein RecT
MSEQNKTLALSPLQRFGLDLNTVYKKQITNFLGDDKKAGKFISSIVADIQRNPKLLECTRESLVNSYMTMAQLGFMPSQISGEAYVIPYSIKGTMLAQLQIGYQGFVTLFYQAGIERITSDIVRKGDKTSFINGELRHEIDLTKSSSERGEPIGAYVRVTFRGVDNVKYMNAKDILDHAKKFSKSFDLTGKFSPWNSANDPELNMWKKTVLKQQQKFLPKNEIINKALAIDNADSIISDRLEPAKEETSSLTMGNLIKSPDENKKAKETKEDKNQTDTSQGMESPEWPKDDRQS